MDFVRMHITSDPTTAPSLRGIIASTTDCNGPYISQERGMDAMCCSKCYIVRQQIYKQIGTFISNNITIEYLHCLQEVQEDCASSCVLTTCGNPLLHISPGNSELEADNVKEALKEQFLLWRHLHIIDVVQKENIGFTHMGVPVVFPSDDCITQEQYGGDEGVKIENNILTITDGKKAFTSGKWAYLIGYYATLNLLYGINGYMAIV